MRFLIKGQQVFYTNAVDKIILSRGFIYLYFVVYLNLSNLNWDWQMTICLKDFWINCWLTVNTFGFDWSFLVKEDLISKK